MPDSLKNSIRNIPGNLNKDPAGLTVLGKAGLTALVKAADEEYNRHREIIREVYGDDFEPDN